MSLIRLVMEKNVNVVFSFFLVISPKPLWIKDLKERNKNGLIIYSSDGLNWKQAANFKR